MKNSTLNFNTLLLGTCLLLTFLTTNAQTQKGNDIDGESKGDYSGVSVSMPDANTIAIGSPFNNDTTGQVRIYNWNGSVWIQKGNDIEGESKGDYSGVSVSMPNANTVAIGAFANDGVSGDLSGHVRIFGWSGSDWIQKGKDIDGQKSFVLSGYSVCMPDSNTVATTEFVNDSFFGLVYTWNGSDWIIKGQAIIGLILNHSWDESNYVHSSIYMPDANTIAIGGYIDFSSSTNSGSICVYVWNGTDWVNKGQTINGEAAGDLFGSSISMPDANTIAIGAPNNDGNGADAGHVRVYTWNGWAWFLKGSDIEGEASGDYSGRWLSMPDTNTIAIGANGNGTGAGHVRVFNWNGSDWVQNGNDFEGENSYDSSGVVSMPDANTLAIGAPANDGNGTDAGHVRVYNLSNSNILENSFGFDIKAYPIPTRGNVNIELNANYPNLSVVVRNIEGKEMIKKSFSNTNNFQIRIPGESGIYSIEISAQDKKALLNIVKE